MLAGLIAWSLLQAENLVADTARVQNLFGTLVGALATVFALVASTAVLLLQQVASSSPTGMAYFPTAPVKLVVTFLAGLLVADGVLYFGLDLSQGWMQAMASLALASHAVAATAVVWLVISTSRWFTPIHTVQAVERGIDLIRDAGGRSLAETDDLRVEQINALNELNATYCARRYSSTVPPLVRAYKRIIRTYPVYHPDHPYPKSIGRLAMSVGQFGVNLAENSLETYVKDMGELLALLLLDRQMWRGRKAHRGDDNLPGDSLRIAAERVLGATVERRQFHAAAAFVREIGGAFKTFARSDATATGVNAPDLLGRFLGEFFLLALYLGLEHRNPAITNDAIYWLGKSVELGGAIGVDMSDYYSRALRTVSLWPGLYRAELESELRMWETVTWHLARDRGPEGGP